MLAKGFTYLLAYADGRTIQQVADHFHVNRKTIHRYMARAAASLVDHAQHTLVAETFPLMTKVLNAALQQQLDKAAKGEAIDTQLVERLLKGLAITDTPQAKTNALAPMEGEGAVETLAGFVAQRVLPPAPTPKTRKVPVIDVEKVEDK